MRTYFAAFTQIHMHVYLYIHVIVEKDGHAQWGGGKERPRQTQLGSDIVQHGNGKDVFFAHHRSDKWISVRGQVDVSWRRMPSSFYDRQQEHERRDFEQRREPGARWAGSTPYSALANTAPPKRFLLLSAHQSPVASPSLIMWANSSYLHIRCQCIW